jgi:hypothetical protein
MGLSAQCNLFGDFCLALNVDVRQTIDSTIPSLTYLNVSFCLAIVFMTKLAEKEGELGRLEELEACAPAGAFAVPSRPLQMWLIEEGCHCPPS